MITPTKEVFLQKSKQGNLIPVYREILADMETPVSAFRKIDSGKYAYLLESVEGGEKWGRYSFLGANPSRVFRCKGRSVTILKDGVVEQSKEVENPVAALKEMIAPYKPVPMEGLPRFFGGVVGYFSYDMVRFFEDLPAQTEDDLNLPDAVFMLTDTILIFDNVSLKIKVVSNVHLDEGLDPAEEYDRAVERINRIIDDLKKPMAHPPLEMDSSGEVEFSSNFSKAEYQHVVERCKEYIKAGDIFQVVPSQRFQARVSGDPFRIYRALRNINPSPYLRYLKLDDFCLVGSSPEVLVRVEEGEVIVRPIAGTRPRGKSLAEDRKMEEELLADPKEKAEHLMLVDLGRNDVGRVAKSGSVRVEEFMIIERYSHVMHIVSNVVGQLREDRDAFDVLAACFPAGTVSGAPKIRAMEIIEEMEPTRRGPYAGAVGYISYSGNLDTCITIRTLLIKDGVAYVQAGGGVVADSNPETEYYETVNKAKALIRAVEAVS
jgi:anthranilate synthase component 1